MIDLYIQNKIRYVWEKSHRKSIMESRTYEDGIYKVYERYYVFGESDEIGKTVKVVKGRKFPVGNEYVIKRFWSKCYNYHEVKYAIMETGEFINIDNIELTEPIVIKEKIRYHSDGKECSHCHSTKLVWIGESFDPGWDEYHNNYTCNECGASNFSIV